MLIGISPPSLVRSYEIRPVPSLLQQTNPFISATDCPGALAEDSFSGSGNQACESLGSASIFSAEPQPNSLGSCILNVYETVGCDNEDEPAAAFADGDGCESADAVSWKGYTVTNCDD